MLFVIFSMLSIANAQDRHNEPNGSVVGRGEGTIDCANGAYQGHVSPEKFALMQAQCLEGGRIQIQGYDAATSRIEVQGALDIARAHEESLWFESVGRTAIDQTDADTRKLAIQGAYDLAKAKTVDLHTLTPAQIAALQPGTFEAITANNSGVVTPAVVITTNPDGTTTAATGPRPRPRRSTATKCR